MCVCVCVCVHGWVCGVSVWVGIYVWVYVCAGVCEGVAWQGVCVFACIGAYILYCTSHKKSVLLSGLIST